jgi:uncharacterized protein YuzE
MQLEYDLSVGALYIRLSDQEIARTRDVDDNTNVDLDASGVVVGIEVIDTGLPWPVAEILRDFDFPAGEVEQIISYFPFTAPTISVASPPPAKAQQPAAAA